MGDFDSRIQEENSSKEKKNKKTKIAIILFVLLILLAAFGAGGFWFYSESEYEKYLAIYEDNVSSFFHQEDVMIENTLGFNEDLLKLEKIGDRPDFKKLTDDIDSSLLKVEKAREATSQQQDLLLKLESDHEEISSRFLFLYGGKRDFLANAGDAIEALKNNSDDFYRSESESYALIETGQNMFSDFFTALKIIDEKGFSGALPLKVSKYSKADYEIPDAEIIKKVSPSYYENLSGFKDLIKIVSNMNRAYGEEDLDRFLSELSEFESVLEELEKKAAARGSASEEEFAAYVEELIPVYEERVRAIEFLARTAIKAAEDKAGKTVVNKERVFVKNRAIVSLLLHANDAHFFKNDSYVEADDTEGLRVKLAEAGFIGAEDLGIKSGEIKYLYEDDSSYIIEYYDEALGASKEIEIRRRGWGQLKRESH